MATTLARGTGHEHVGEVTTGTAEADSRPVSNDAFLVRAGGVAAVLALVSQVFQVIYQQVTGTAVEIAMPVWGNVAYTGQIALMPLFIVAMYLAQRRAFGGLGRTATLVALVGAVLWSAASMDQLLAAIVAEGAKPPDPPDGVIVVILSFFAVYVVGLFLLGIATWRAGVLPRRAAALLTIGIPIALGPGGLVPVLFLVYGSGIAALGVSAMRRVGVR
jgi:hypothetical protein